MTRPKQKRSLRGVLTGTSPGWIAVVILAGIVAAAVHHHAILTFLTTGLLNLTNANPLVLSILGAVVIAAIAIVVFGRVFARGGSLPVSVNGLPPGDRTTTLRLIIRAIVQIVVLGGICFIVLVIFFGWSPAATLDSRTVSLRGEHSKLFADAKAMVTDIKAGRGTSKDPKQVAQAIDALLKKGHGVFTDDDVIRLRISRANIFAATHEWHSLADELVTIRRGRVPVVWESTIRLLDDIYKDGQLRRREHAEMEFGDDSKSSEALQLEADRAIEAGDMKTACRLLRIVLQRLDSGRDDDSALFNGETESRVCGLLALALSSQADPDLEDAARVAQRGIDVAARVLERPVETSIRTSVLRSKLQSLRVLEGIDATNANWQTATNHALNGLALCEELVVTMDHRSSFGILQTQYANAEYIVEQSGDKHKLKDLVQRRYRIMSQLAERGWNEAIDAGRQADEDLKSIESAG